MGFSLVECGQGIGCRKVNNTLALPLHTAAGLRGPRMESRGHVTLPLHTAAGLRGPRLESCGHARCGIFRTTRSHMIGRVAAFMRRTASLVRRASSESCAYGVTGATGEI